jgi:FMN reductase
MRCLVLSCSLNPASRSRILARAAADRLDSMAVETDFFDVQSTPLPLCDGGACYGDPAVKDLSFRVLEAQGILVATPIYNYGVNAACKNLIELTGRSWTDKVVGFLCAAGGMTSYMSVMPLASSLMLDFRCVVLPRFVYARESSFNGDTIVDEQVAERIGEITRRLVRIAAALAPDPAPTRTEADAHRR